MTNEKRISTNTIVSEYYTGFLILDEFRAKRIRCFLTGDENYRQSIHERIRQVVSEAKSGTFKSNLLAEGDLTDLELYTCYLGQGWIKEVRISAETIELVSEKFITRFICAYYDLFWEVNQRSEFYNDPCKVCKGSGEVCKHCGNPAEDCKNLPFKTGKDVSWIECKQCHGSGHTGGIASPELINEEGYIQGEGLVCRYLGINWCDLFDELNEYINHCHPSWKELNEIRQYQVLESYPVTFLDKVKSYFKDVYAPDLVDGRWGS